MIVGGASPADAGIEWSPVMPSLKALAMRALPNVVEGVVVPTAVFYLALPGYGVWGALVATTAASYVLAGRRLLQKRRVGGLLLLGLVTLTFRLVLAVATGNPALYYLQPIGAKLVVAVAFLASLRSATPLLQRLAEDFVVLPPAAHGPLRRFFAAASAGWAVMLVTHSVVAGWMLVTQPIEVYVVAKTAANLVFKGGAVLATYLGFRMTVRRLGIGAGDTDGASVHALERA